MPRERIGIACLRSLAVIAIALATSACQRNASAQAVRDPLGPVRCYEISTAAQLSSQSALELCSGALSDAPGRCYDIGTDNFHELSTQKLLSLCARATTLQPTACYSQLAAEGTLTEDQIIAYCTTACPVGPAPPEASSPDCLAAAIDRTDLSLQLAGELCLRSSSAGPVDCFNAGQALQTLSDSQLIQLCAERFQCQYYNAPAAGTY